MQTTGKDNDNDKEQTVTEGEDLNSPLSVEFLKLIAQMASKNELIELALEELHPGVKEMLEAQETTFILGFVNCAQYLHDMISGLLVDTITTKYNPTEELDSRDSQTIRLAAMIDAAAYYCVTLLAERGYVDLDVKSN